jgi:alpha-L-rhamnosidase
MMKDSRNGARQTAYKIILGMDSAGVASGKPVFWESVKTVSSSNLHVYHGNPLQPFTKYYWRVILWDQNGITASGSEVAHFETGMMESKNWKGAWISDDNDINVKPAPMFRSAFRTSKKITSARAYVAAAGLYELYINGKPIGDQRLNPMYTRFDRRNLYVTHDVTAALQTGENAIGVLLGNGWYNHQSTAVWYFHRAPWRARPAFCLDLRITYADGTVETIRSGKDWKTATGPIIFNSIYTAEHYNANLEQKGWSEPGFADSTWKPVTLRSVPSPQVVAQALQPIRNVEEIVPKSLKRLDSLTWVYDLGRNISGVSSISVSGAKGTIIRLKHGERLLNSGRVDLSNIDVHYRPTDDTDPFQTDIFILSGKGEEKFMPRFNYKGFQFVEVTASNPVTLTVNNLKGYFMHSDVPAVGTIKSSNPVIEKILKANNNSYLSNLFGYPTDCPQREKNGWTGDAHIASETGLYGFDGITVYEKWMADHRDEQQPNGVLPSIIPTGGWGYEWGNGPDWTSTVAIIPWNLFLFYGDSRALSDNYEAISKYVDHINELYPSGLTTWGLGDWVPVKSVSPVEFTSTAYYFTDVTILSKAARLLGKKADAEKYSRLAEKIKSAFNQKYFNAALALYGTGLQTELSVALHAGLVPDAHKERVGNKLAERVMNDGVQLDVGILGAKAILNALSENGHADLAYRLAVREEYPSWGWWIKNGATTLYENWNINAAHDVSLNHVMFGEVAAWFYKGLGGIKPDENTPGFKNVLLEPHFIDGLDEFEATHAGPFGVIRSAWKKEGGVISWNISIPANSSATVRLKANKVLLSGKPVDGGKPIKLVSGNHSFRIG